MVKTVYDPCPCGYCIPNARVFTGFTKTGNNTFNTGQFNVDGTWDNGWNFKNANGGSVFFPALGCRFGTTGLFPQWIGREGRYWSACAFSSSSSSHLAFGIDYINSMTYDYRSSSFSVRPCKIQ